jgi:hypothetical protein
MSPMISLLSNGKKGGVVRESISVYAQSALDGWLCRVKRIWLPPGPQTVRVHWYNTTNATAASRRSSEAGKAWNASSTSGFQATANLDRGVPEIGLMAWVLTNKRYG